MSGGGVSVPLADVNPLAESGTAVPGSLPMAVRADHRHPRLTSATSHSLDVNGEATVVFTRTFSTQPSMAFSYTETADGQPLVFKVKSWTQDGSLNYTGCVVKGYRSTTIPTNLVTLLLGGVFNLFQGSANGVPVTVIALQSSS